MLRLIVAHVFATLRHKARVADYMWRARHLARAEQIPPRQWLRRALVHDMSKFSRAEVAGFARATPVLAIAPYGSEQYEAGRAALGPALAHHYAHNRHHPEFHVPRQNGAGAWRYMTPADRLEMLCDWAAAVERSPNGDLYESIAGNAGRFAYGPDEARILTGWAWRIGVRPRDSQLARALAERMVQEEANRVR